MKYVKMLGLAAVAAMVLMAFLGASSASATVLCKTPNTTTDCKESAWHYPTNTVIDSSLEETASLETTGGTVLDTCKGGTVKGKTTNTGSSTETVDGFIEQLTWSECTKTTNSLHNANPATEGTFGTLEIHWISNTDNGTVTGKNTRVTINTIFGSCTYGTEAGGNHIGTLTAGSMGTLHIEATIPLISGGGLCPPSGRWTGSYTITEPEPIYIATS